MNSEDTLTKKKVRVCFYKAGVRHDKQKKITKYISFPLDDMRIGLIISTFWQPERGQQYVTQSPEPDQIIRLLR